MDRAIARIAARQEFVISLPQLAEAGLSAGAARKRVAAGRLWRVHRGVFATTPKLTRRGQFFAAVLACGDGAVLSHQSAAHEHEIRKHEYGPVHVTVPADVLTPTQLQLAMSTAERLNLVNRARLMPEPGRRAVTKQRHLFTRSENERALFALCRGEDLWLPDSNITLGRWEVDFLWPEHGLVVEVDAWHTHGNPRTFETDRLKDEFLDDIGLKVRRITDVRLHNEPDSVARAVRRALGACTFDPDRDVTAWTRRAVA